VNYLDELNQEQKEAVLHTDGPLLILAGAGAGKTKTLTYRILHIIKKGINPRQVLAITFTNKAAKEMRDRVTRLLSEDKELNLPISFETQNNTQNTKRASRAEWPFVSTFHSLGVHILKENAQLIGLTRNFTIYDKNDSYRAIKEAIQEEGLDPKKFEPRKFQHAISSEKGNMLTVEKYANSIGREYFSTIVAAVWKRYEATLRKEQALDFDDLLLKTGLILQNYPEILAHYQETWKYIHIDEYQDTNRVQYTISKLLSAKYRNLCVVGDIDQNIYGWRGADIRNILDFEKDYSEARVIVLEQNYRSTQTILSAANTIIKKNKKRREKNLFTKNGVGEKITLFEAYDEIDEAHFIATKAKELIEGRGVRGVEESTNNKISPNEIAVLFRANFQSRVLEEAFIAHEVPYQLLGTRFFERKEVKDTLSYIRAALNPESLADIKRVINTPARGVGKITLLKVLAGKEYELGGAVREKVVHFRKILEKIREAAKKEKTSDLVKLVLTESGMEADYKKSGTEEDMERLENLQELVTLATKYDAILPPEGTEKLIEEAALQSDQDELQSETKADGTKKLKDGVKLMTVHASKGLEFEYVFITGLEEDLFPHKRLTEEHVSEEQSEEERRLFYVALTRAKKKLFLTFTGVRTIFGSKHVNIPSEFLSDIDDALLEMVERGDTDLTNPHHYNSGKVIYFD
jgi:DNA helicase-2/ATP-dependent DNA helicase PcrA